jgi:hypothetical protein
MKRIIAIVLFVSAFAVAHAQTGEKVKNDKAEVKSKVKDCRKISANLNSGTVNGLKPTALPADVKKKLPCFTGESAEGGNINCGGGVFYLNNDIYFYTGRDYIEMRGSFSGTTSPSVLGFTRDELVILFGKADRVVDGGRVLIYTKPYGSLRLVFNMEGRCAEVGIHAVTPDKIEMCE